MRSGSYLLTSPEGPAVVERFSCGPDGDGWSYAGTRWSAAGEAPLARLHLRLDAAGVLTRLHVETSGWVLRGGCVGSAVLWRRGDEEREQVADGFTGPSPAYALATLRRLGLAVGESRRVRLVEVTEPVLATRLVDRSWSRPEPQRWVVDDLATGDRREVELDRLEEGLVVAGTGLTLTRS